MSNKEAKKFVIIDGNAIIHRAYHALPPLTSKAGIMVNAVYGFALMLFKVLGDLKPDYLAVSFDVAGGTFRDKLYEGYKAKRVKADQELYDQIPLIHELVQAFGIPIYLKEGFEADDVIGTVVTKIINQNAQSIIVTGDMDLLQLVVDEAVEVYLLRKGLSDFELYNEAKVTERFGFGPEHIVDYKALCGDVSDNIPGVRGIGEKTAKDLIGKVGGIEEIYRQILNPKSKIINLAKPVVLKKLRAGENSAKLSQEMATIVRDVPGLNFDLEKCVVRELDREKLLPLFQKYGFTSLLRRLPGGELLKPENTKKLKQNSRSTATGQRQVRKINNTILIEPSNFEKFIEQLKTKDVFICKEIISGPNVLEGQLVGLVFVVQNTSYFVDLAKLSNPRVQEMFKLFTRADAILVGHDLKQLIKVLQLQGVEARNRLFDIMIASYLLNSNTRAHDMRSIALRELGVELPSTAQQGSLFGMDPSVVAHELTAVRDVYEIYHKQLESEADQGLFDKIEMALIPVLADMELNGVAVDTETLRKLSVEAIKIVKNLTQKIWKEAGVEFNIASTAQLRDILYEKMGLKIPGIKKGKTGYSTAASELEKLRGAHPIIDLIEDFREITKLQNTYIDVLPTLINKITGRIHTSFNQAVTTTGRLSSSDPNLQNIPIRTELGKRVRDAFIAEAGCALISADYSQIELRIVASLAEDKHLIEIFQKGEDVHRATAAVINGVPLDKVTREMRNAAKEINFGVLYGMGSFGLSWRAGISQWQAKDFIKKYFEQFAGVKKYIEQTLIFAKKEGYVETLFGRRRYIPELQSQNFQLRSAGERMAINMPIQGTAADLMKMAMIAVHKNIKILKHKNNNVRLILQVHDELVIEVRKGLEDEIAKILKEEMEKVAKLRVPVEVHVSVGKRWGELK